MSNYEEQYNTLSRLPRFRRDKRKTKKKVSNSIVKGERKALSSPYGYNLRKTIRKRSNATKRKQLMTPSPSNVLNTIERNMKAIQDLKQELIRLNKKHDKISSDNLKLKRQLLTPTNNWVVLNNDNSWVVI